MLIDSHDERLLDAISDGLPLLARPYAAIGRAIGLDEAQVLTRLGRMIEAGVIKRFGVVVRHHELGFDANAMVVWDVADSEIEETGRRVAAYPCVNLCYERPRRLPDWPYNLFAMIHGKDREHVLAVVAEINRETGLDQRPHDALFSLRRFKQRGARYCRPARQRGAA